MYTSKRRFRFLTENDRVKIEAWYKRGLSQSEIARELGVHRSTVCRELRRGLCEQLDGDTWKIYHTYSSQIAQQKHEWAQTSKGAALKIGNNHAYLNAIQERVLQKHSFEEAISYVAQTADYDMRISKQTAYRYLQLGLFSRLSCSSLPQCPRRKRRGKVRRVNTAYPDHRSIEQRPAEIRSREQLGHWEMDSVIGKQKGLNESCLVLTERKTRQEVVLKPEGKTAAATVAALQKLRKSIGADFPRIFRTITCDNGSEFSDRKGMETDAARFFWCHPQSPGERGSNENANRLVRRLLPKGKSLSRISPEQAKEVQRWINDYRRPILGGRCSNDVFFEELDKLGLQDPERVKKFFL